jgi:hypothetical protein
MPRVRAFSYGRWDNALGRPETQADCALSDERSVATDDWAKA